MSAIALAAFLQLATACGQPSPPQMLAGIAKQESGFQPYAIHDDTTSRSLYPESADAAVAAASALIAAGHNVGLGLMQVEQFNLPKLGMTVADAFDPCRNIRAGAEILRRNYRVALSMYNTGRVSPVGLAYAQRVERAAGSLDAPAPAPSAQADPPPSSPWERFLRAGKAYVVFDN